MKRGSRLMILLLLLFGCVALGILTYVPGHQLRQSFSAVLSILQITTEILLIVLGLSVGLAVVIGLIWLAAIAYASGVVWHSMARSRQADALKREREATLVLTVAPPGSQVYASEVVGKLDLTHKPLHLAPNIVCPEFSEPTVEQIKRWSFFQLTHTVSKKPEVATAEIPQLQQPLPEHVDLNDYISGSTSLRYIFLGVGRLPNGQVHLVSAPLSRLVHIAVAGASGFGKSTFMQSLGYQVLNAREGPGTVMLDAQGVTFTSFDGNERLYYPLASEREDIKAILHELVAEMDNRKKLFGRWRAIDSLDKYNSVTSPKQRLPAIPIFFDEFGLLADDTDIAAYMKRLSQAGRKFGMYLIAGSQTWYSDEIASSLKANLSTSVQFHAKSKSESRVLLGDSAAYNILRPGQAYCRMPGHAGLIELQAPDTRSVISITPTSFETSNAQTTMPTMPQPEPTAKEQAILDLFDEQAKKGEFNKAKICLKVFGSKGGNQYQKIDEILEKFGRM